MQSVLTKSTTHAPVSATTQTFTDFSSAVGTCDPRSATSPAPVSAGATQRIPVIHLWTYFHAHGYRNVVAALVERADATILTATLPCGDTVRLWQYPGVDGVGIQVKSKSHAGRWYTVTANHCECTRWHYQHRCPHHDIAASEAMEVYDRWQQYSADDAQKAVAA